jgi:hypothetical protein
MKFSPATLTRILAVTVLGGFALASLQGANCSGDPQINNVINVCVAVDGGPCDNEAITGSGATPTPQSSDAGGFDDPIAGEPCASQFDCYFGEPLDQCLRAACVEGFCKTVVNAFQSCTPFGLSCVVGTCMPSPDTSLYPAYCSFGTAFSPYEPQLLPGTCLLDNQCFEGGDLNPQNSCEVCIPGDGFGVWSSIANGLSCLQGGVVGTCQTGECVVEESDTTGPDTSGDEETTGDEPDDTTAGTTTDTTGATTADTTGGDTGTDTSGTDTTGTTTTDGGTSEADTGTGTETTGTETTGDETTGDETTGDETGDGTTGE